MPYIFKQKLLLTDLLGPPRTVKVVLIVEPEEYLLGIYIQLLEHERFKAIGTRTVDALHKTVEDLFPHLLVINTEIFPKPHHAAGVLKIISRSFPSMPIITLGRNTEHEELKDFMALGVMGHIDRRFSRPQDLVDVAKTILNN